MVAENEQRSSLLCRWLSTRFDCQQKTIEAAWADLAQGQRCDLVMISLEAKDSALSPLQLMERIASCGRRIPVVAIVSDLCLLPSPEAALFTDFIATPLTEGGVVQRAQLVLSLQESEVRERSGFVLISLSDTVAQKLQGAQHCVQEALPGQSGRDVAAEKNGVRKGTSSN